ncbi:MAG: hypothetical protein AAGG02_02785 [Cyanobacteria bacterium P01_H01_bin.15]
MERGLLWLPLLAIFIGLAWAGWNEYQKVEAYRRWAEDFDHAKYDVRAVLGQKDGQLTWGKPTRSGPVNLYTLSLSQIQQIQLFVNQQAVSSEPAPAKGSPELAFELKDGNQVKIPFTEIELAVLWQEYLSTELGARSQA